MDGIEDQSVHLMVTSPPYPMIGMWDAVFSEQNPEINIALKGKDGAKAFELMHQELDKVWDGIYRVLIDGGIMCINIGDATRTIDGTFQLYSNHSRILNHCLKLGFAPLPEIIWRKQTNAPNKFMGSGMLPSGAYITLEHEFILILRKGDKREFKSQAEKSNRQESSFFWEERNVWFSDIWDFKGTRQKLNGNGSRDRSAAYPFELAYRLINMFSVKGDVVLDPFLGTGTTMIAAMASGRDSIGIEIDPSFRDTIISRTKDVVRLSNEYIGERMDRHMEFVRERIKTKGELGYTNIIHAFPVMTRQEVGIRIDQLKEIRQIQGNFFEVSYREYHQESICKDWEEEQKIVDKLKLISHY
jgi:DNA modification methylase